MSFEALETAKQSQIINAACEVFAKHGYRKASMKDIAETAGVSKSVLFKYFETKENLYIRIFRLTTDGILAADENAHLASAPDADVFERMRNSVRERLKLFEQNPWVFRFSYSAAFDPDPFVQELVRSELQKTHASFSERSRQSGTDALPEYRTLRKDVPPEAARKLIFWVSQGFLEEKLQSGDTEPNTLWREYDQWIGILELLLRSEQTGSKSEGGLEE